MTKQQKPQDKKMTDSKVLMMEVIEKQTTKKEAEKFAQKTNK